MENGVMMQYFEWNLPNDGYLWKALAKDAPHLAEIGVTAVWIPPPCKADRQENQGYAAYDLFDLGEFNQKGTVRTKYGTRRELEAAIAALHRQNISVYLDAVMNHKAGADFTEKFQAQEVDPNQRENAVAEPREIEGWTGFDFPGRAGKYSDFKWGWQHFTGVDYDKKTDKTGIFRILGDGKSWADGVDGEFGNYDYLMFADIDFDHPDVKTEMIKWGKWVSRELNLDGMRLDAIKHINDAFIRDFVKQVRADRGGKFYAVGEYWKDDVQSLDDYLKEVEGAVDLFDVSLHFNFFQASEQGRDYDMTGILNDSLALRDSVHAVTFVDNHDSQWGSSLQSTIKDWFKPLAYGLILLMREGYPCVFYGDYYRIGDKESPHRTIIDACLAARKRYAYGEQTPYFDHGNTVGLVRAGDPERPGSGLAFLMATGDDGVKVMNVGANRAGETWRELTGNIADTVTIGDDGNAEFHVSGGNIAIWVQEEAPDGA